MKKVAKLLYAKKLHRDVWMFSKKLSEQFAKYGTDFSIERNLNCTDIAEAYHDYKEPLCGGVRKGFIELFALSLISIPL